MVFHLSAPGVSSPGSLLDQSLRCKSPLFNKLRLHSQWMPWKATTKTHLQRTRQVPSKARYDRHCCSKRHNASPFSSPQGKTFLASLSP